MAALEKLKGAVEKVKAVNTVKNAAVEPDTLLSAPYRAPSFKDLRRTCAYLQGRLQDALAANEALSQQNEALRIQQQIIADAQEKARREEEAALALRR